MTSAAAKRSASSPGNRQGLLILAIVIIVVAVVAITAILLSGNQGGDGADTTNIPQSRAADGGFVLGNPDAPITIIEFSDFACSHCQEYHPTVTKFITDYVATGKAKFEYRLFPTAGGQLSYYTGQLVECAENQKAGSFWKSYNLMFSYAMSGRYTQDVGRLLATDLGLSYSDLLSCSNNATQVQTDINLGTQSGVTGTPATMVRYNDGPAQFISYNGRTYNQGGAPYAVLAAVVDAAQG